MIGNIEMRDVTALVTRSVELDKTYLEMSFLHRLKRYSVFDKHLILDE